MSILCSISAIKEPPRTIQNIMFDSKLTFKPFTLLEEFPFGFLSPFLCIPRHSRSLEVIIQHIYIYSVFSLTWPASMQTYWNKRKRLHKKRVQLPQDWFGTQIWPPWSHVKTNNLQSYYLLLWSIVKRSKELSKLQCFWDFYILFQSLKGKQLFFLSYLAITDTRSSPWGCLR